MAGAAHFPWVGGQERGPVDAEDLVRLDGELVRLGALVAAAAARSGDDPRARLAEAIDALLDGLARDVEATWRWVAVWPASSDPAVAARRARADELLAGALGALGFAPRAAELLVRDGWQIVHEHLWAEAEPDLPGLRAPLMALAALRGAGLGAVRAELAGARGA